MELPKNVTQIGEADHSCKIYVEDYVISYMKQMNITAARKEQTLALFGTKREDDEISYIFLYGACKIQSLEKGSKHLSQAQQQEIEKIRKKYFSNYTFRGYCVLNGEMVEGFYIFEQGICRYITGYAQFYEKNESMLAYMLASRQKDAEPEVVEREKYEAVRRRQEERKAKCETKGKKLKEERKVPREEKKLPKDAIPNSATMNYMKISAAAVFTLLCVTGVSAIGEEETKQDIKNIVAQLMEGITEQKLPDTAEVAEVINRNQQINTLVTEDKLSEVLQMENSSQWQNDVQAQDSEPLNNNQTKPSQQQPEELSEIPSQPLNNNQTKPSQQQPEELSETSSQPLNNNQTKPSQQQPEELSETSSQPLNNNQTKPSQQQPEELSETPSQPLNNNQTKPSQQQPEELSETPSQLLNNNQTEPSQNQNQQVSQNNSYQIKKGDTLTAISVKNYGTDAKVSDICALNEIKNPDDIKEGQKILLP